MGKDDLFRAVLEDALNEASLAIAQAERPRVAKREMRAALLGLLDGLRASTR